MTPTGFDDHDHTACIDGVLATVEQACAEEGLQLTPVRRRTLELLLAEHRAMGAYDVLQRLAEDGSAAKVRPCSLAAATSVPRTTPGCSRRCRYTCRRPSP